MGEPFMPPVQPEKPKDEEKKVENIIFTYPDGSTGVASSKKEAADKIEEYREGQK